MTDDTEQEGPENASADSPAESPPEDAEEAVAEMDGEEGGNDLLAEWEAMAEEGEDAGGGEAAATGATDSPEGSADEPAINQVDLETYAILGTSTMPVSQLLRMGRGAVVELNTTIGDQIELRINDLPIAMGEVVVVEDRIAVEVTDILKRTGK